MARYLGPKCKLSSREGTDLFLKSGIKPLENKSIISIEGSNLFRVVDTDELIDDKGKFKLPTGTLTLKGEVYTAGAVQPEKLFNFASINNDQEINNKILELEQKFELKFDMLDCPTPIITTFS